VVGRPNSALISAPEILEPCRRQLGVAHSVLNVAMSEVRLQRPSVVPLIGQCVAASVPEHVRMRLEIQLGLDPGALNHAGDPNDCARRSCHGEPYLDKFVARARGDLPLMSVASTSTYRTAWENGISRLFHYQTYKPEFLESTIKSRLVRFGRASDFNDPWDCKPSFFVPDDERELQRLIEYFDRAGKKHGVDAAARAARMKVWLSNPQQLRDDITANSAAMWAEVDKRYRIYCLSVKSDDQLMWGHYADHHRGVCLEFNSRTTDFGAAIEVEYKTTYPQYSLADETDISPLYTKSADWSYEKEYRVIAQEANEAIGAGTLMTTDDGFFRFAQGALISVIVGSSATASSVREITELAQGSGILVRTAVRVPHRYELTFDPPLGVAL
jgi:hypothetical protein